MKNKLFRLLVCCLVCLMLVGTCPAFAQTTPTDHTAEAFIDGIVSHKTKQGGAAAIQNWIDTDLAQNAGVSAEWYAIGLSQYGKHDLARYERALLDYLAEHPVYAASTRLKYAMALIASGSVDGYIRQTLEDAIGQQGVMSWIYGLHLLNNGYESTVYSADEVKQQLLSMQLSDGGWAVRGTAGDVDITAMAIQALAPDYAGNATVRRAIDRALALLSDRQEADGDYASYGVRNPESTAQVLVALSALGIDCKTDGRFIKNGHTLFDGMGLYRLPDGTFCHKAGGSFNETATAQVFYGSVAYLRMKNGQSPFYLLDARNPAGLKAEMPVTSVPTATPSHQSSQIADTSSAPISSVTESAVSTSSVDETATSGASADATSGTANSESNTTDTRPQTGGYKLWVCFAIGAVSLGACSVLFMLKRRNKINFLVILAIGAAVILFVLLTDFQTADRYYGQTPPKDNPVGTVTLSIRCDTVAGKAEHIPDDGVLLKETSYEITAGETVYDILTQATAANRIHLETTGVGDAVYVEGLGHIYEFDHGDLSGWVYRVNGQDSSVSCGEYVLMDGDEIQWLYTCELSDDLDK